MSSTRGAAGTAVAAPATAAATAAVAAATASAIASVCSGEPVTDTAVMPELLLPAGALDVVAVDGVAALTPHCWSKRVSVMCRRPWARWVYSK